jgi:hypothetical protein
MQNRPISNTHPRGGVRGVEQGLHFLLRQIWHQTMVGLLEGYRQNAANLFDGSWLSMLQKPEERANSG